MRTGFIVIVSMLIFLFVCGYLYVMREDMSSEMRENKRSDHKRANIVEMKLSTRRYLIQTLSCA